MPAFDINFDIISGGFQDVTRTHIRVGWIVWVIEHAYCLVRQLTFQCDIGENHRTDAQEFFF